MEGIGAAAQDYRSVPQMPRCPSWWPDDQRNGEPCALKGASTVRGEALGRPRKRRLAPTLPRRRHGGSVGVRQGADRAVPGRVAPDLVRSEEHTSELQSLMRISYAVFCLKKKTHTYTQQPTHNLMRLQE